MFKVFSCLSDDNVMELIIFLQPAEMEAPFSSRPPFLSTPAQKQAKNVEKSIIL